MTIPVIGTISAWSQAFGAAVAGSRDEAERNPASTGRARTIDTVFSLADTALNGTDSSRASSGLSAALKRNAALGGDLLDRELGRPVLMDEGSRQQAMVLQRIERTAEQRLATAEAAAAGGDPVALQELEVARAKAADARAGMLHARTLGSVSALEELQSELVRRYPNSAGWERYLEDADPRADARAATSPEERATISERLLVALNVGVARLSSLRARIQELDYLIRTGGLTPEREAELVQLQQDLAGNERQVELVGQARGRLQREQVAERATLRGQYEQTERKVVRIAETIERVSGKSLTGGAAVDWDTLSPEQALERGRAIIAQQEVVIQEAVTTGDYSKFDAMRATIDQGWADFAKECREYDQRVARDAAKRLEQRVLEQDRNEQRSFDAALDQHSVERRAFDAAIAGKVP